MRIKWSENKRYGSNIKDFTKEQCREVVFLLGNAGYVSVTEGTNMENYGKNAAMMRIATAMRMK